MNRDNVSLDDSDLALSELKRYQALGGHTVVDATNIGIGREPEKLARIARMSGLKIVMGTGFYLEHTHPEWLKAMDVDAVTEFIVNDVGGGETQPAILAGLIGEVGVSKDFTAEETKVAASFGTRLAHHRRAAVDPSARLGAAGAQGARCRGGGRCRSSAHRALPHEPEPSRSRLSDKPCPARRVSGIRHDRHGLLLCRSGRAIALRRGECPCDPALVDLGFGDRLLLSQDVFLKIMLTRYGGFGYGYILKHFVPRLKRHGARPGQPSTAC